MSPEQWQIDLQNCIRNLDGLEKYIPVLNRDKMEKVLSNMRLSITPHTRSLIDFDNPNDPLLLMCVPQERELVFSPEDLVDPIGDNSKSPVPFLTHRYPDRVIIYVTFSCSQYCRFCFRKSKTGSAGPGPGNVDIQNILKYLSDHPQVEEVILSGGDPLTLVDSDIEEWLKSLRKIKSIRRIRIHTRTLVNLPSRITDDLVSMFKRNMDATNPIYVVAHFNHANEIAEENIQAVAKLVDAGVVVLNQSVLLRGVNDSPVVLEQLFRKLADIRATPYYIHQLDLAQGISHFRVPIERGIQIMQELQGRVSGIALPKYMLDIPGGEGKIPLSFEYAKKISDRQWELKTPFGKTVKYTEPKI